MPTTRTPSRTEPNPIRKRNRRAAHIAAAAPARVLYGVLDTPAIHALRRAHVALRHAVAPTMTLRRRLAATVSMVRHGRRALAAGAQLYPEGSVTYGGERLSNVPLLILDALPGTWGADSPAGRRAVFTGGLIDWLAKTPVGEGLSALTVAIEAAGVEAGTPSDPAVPHDVDARGALRSTGIMPAGLFAVAPQTAFVSVRDRAGDASQTVQAGAVEDALPLLACLDKHQTAPVLRLVAAAGISALTPGRGARIDKRIMIYALLSMPLAARTPGVTWPYKRPLSWWIDRLYPGETWRPSRHGERFCAGLRALVWASVRQPDGSDWLPVAPRQLPNVFDRDSPVQLDIKLPPDSAHGALVSWPRLIKAGTLSDPAFDLVIGLAYLWDQAKAANGGRRIYATRPRARRNADGHVLDRTGAVVTSRPGAPFTRRGRLTWPAGLAPVRDWRHPAAIIEGVERHPQANRVPALTREARRRLAFPVVPAVHGARSCASNQRAAADRLIETHAEAGHVVIERLPDGSWRLLEPAPDRVTP